MLVGSIGGCPTESGAAYSTIVASNRLPPVAAKSTEKVAEGGGKEEIAIAGEEGHLYIGSEAVSNGRFVPSAKPKLGFHCWKIAFCSMKGKMPCVHGPWMMTWPVAPGSPVSLLTFVLLLGNRLNAVS